MYACRTGACRARGTVAETRHLKVAVRSVLIPSGAFPLLWHIGTQQDGDVSLAQPLWEAAVTLWGDGACHELLVDAGNPVSCWKSSSPMQKSGWRANTRSWPRFATAKAATDCEGPAIGRPSPAPCRHMARWHAWSGLLSVTPQATHTLPSGRAARRQESPPTPPTPPPKRPSRREEHT